MSETTTREPRADKVAVVAEVAERLNASQAVFVTEYRGLSVPEMADVRNALRPNDAQYAIYKNTLVRRAVAETGMVGLDEHLVGPTAIAFVNGDIAGAAKALKEAAKATPALVIKGGSLGDSALTAEDISALAELPSREVLLAQLAGGFKAPLTKTARLFAAVPSRFAYAVSALIDKQSA